jgi:BirA family transcriptional regulator, biotin operon repressor / biotin---[acetyl-CoA-carboxylase] ligase
MTADSMAADPLLVHLASTPSTMDVLHTLAEAGAAAGTAVVADEQTAGRGSRGRAWSSPPGGLWLSVLTRPKAAALELLSLRAGLAVAEALEAAGLPRRLALKWPNDLMLDDRKVGGILCEARWIGASPAWVVIGLGLNVANAIPPEVGPMAARLADAAPAVRPASLVGPVVQALQAVDTGTGPLRPEELLSFDQRDWLRGRRIEAPRAGIGAGIDVDGALRVRSPDGTWAAVRSGTIVLANSSTTAELGACS